MYSFVPLFLVRSVRQSIIDGCISGGRRPSPSPSPQPARQSRRSYSINVATDTEPLDVTSEIVGIGVIRRSNGKPRFLGFHRCENTDSTDKTPWFRRWRTGNTGFDRRTILKFPSWQQNLTLRAVRSDCEMCRSRRQEERLCGRRYAIQPP